MSAASLLATLGQWAPLLVVVTPLLLAGLLTLPRLVGRISVLAPWAGLPALLAGLGAPETELLLPGLMLGSSLMIDAIGRPFLVLLALLWLVAGWLAGERLRCRGPALLFLLAMSGSFGLAVAGNLMVFLLASTVGAYALYGLAARQPGARAFLVLLVLSDLLLFELLLLLVKGGIGLSLATAPSAALGGSAILLLLTVLGFGAKAAVFGLHAWLPRMLSGPAAEFGQILPGFVFAAGLLPWVRLLATGEPPGSGAMILAWVALAGLGLAVMLGTLQGSRRALLGYSISALSGFWLVLLSVAGGDEAMPHGTVDASVATMALGQAGLALASLLARGAPSPARQSWLDWSINGFAVLLLADALVAMLGAFSVDARMPVVISAYLLFGVLIGQLLWNRQQGDGAALAFSPRLPLLLVLSAALWAILMADPLAVASVAALALFISAATSLLLAPLLARLPRVPPGDLLLTAVRLPRLLGGR
ncbi:hypothetical protein [Halochromatium salexigens]|uniref:NADH:quinone oxidoreductase/Mrp antiporter membrane subunit domain-containing protein n=1 Tax=Halochromatium salexigens TaxID=49447 RepID=A0AAJ0UF32_HALSE|nr:hypothetical protein [Halochromatium salexigens]MBK5930280.1 hypothetical protein [Halochromatium salexigens]